MVYCTSDKGRKKKEIEEKEGEKSKCIKAEVREIKAYTNQNNPTLKVYICRHETSIKLQELLPTSADLANKGNPTLSSETKQLDCVPFGWNFVQVLHATVSMFPE